MARRKRRTPLDFFRDFRETVARKRAVAMVRRAEKNLGQRITYWENKQQNQGRVAHDPRRDVSGLNTNQLKAYARELNRYRGKDIRSAGIISPAGNLLNEEAVEDYMTMWQAREAEKELWRRTLALKGVDYSKRPMTLVDIDPRTGKPKPTYGGNYVLQNLGDVQLPDTAETLERRRKRMSGWQSIRTRLDTSEANLRAKLAQNDSEAVRKWDRLNRAQKQYLINFENIFDIVESLAYSSKDSEDSFMWQARDGRHQEKVSELHRLLDEAATMEAENPELANRY